MKDHSEETDIIRLFEYCRSEREKMTLAAKNLVTIWDGGRVEGTTAEQELADFIGHFSNIRGFLSKRDRDLSEPKLELVGLLQRVGAYDSAKEELYGILAFPIDYSTKPWKKFRFAIGSRGIDIGGER